MNNESGAISTLVTTIQNVVKSTLEYAGFNKDRNAIIHTINDDGTYNIIVDNQFYEGIRSYGGAYFSENAIVKLVIPNNQASNMYITPTLDAILSEDTVDEWRDLIADL